MREIGQVVRIEEGRIVVQLDPQGGCANCAMNTCCTSTGTGKRELQLPPSKDQLKSGDLVEIETPAKSLLFASFLIFILPILFSIIGYGIIQSRTQSMTYGILGFFAVLLLSGILLYLFDRRFGTHKFFEPQIIGKIHETSG